MRSWLTSFWWRRTTAPPPPPIPRASSSLVCNDEPIPLMRVFPPLGVSDGMLAREGVSKYTEAELTTALETLRGGLAARDKVRRTRPARFHIAATHVSGFSEQCLAIKHGSRVPIDDMYGAYLLWAADWKRDPINRSDFDAAMADKLASVGGIRTEHFYDGCRFRPDFLRRMEAKPKADVHKRLGMGLEELMRRTGNDTQS